MRRWIVTLMGFAVVVLTPDAGTAGFEPHLTLSSDHEFAGDAVEAFAWGFFPAEALSWSWDEERVTPGGPSADRARADGTATVAIRIPANAEVGWHEITVTGERRGPASARIHVDDRSAARPYRLSDMTTTTTPEPTTTTTSVNVPPSPGAKSEPDDQAAKASVVTTSTTAHTQTDVPEALPVEFEGGGSAGPSWLPALIPALIVAVPAGRFFAKHIRGDSDSG